MNLRIRVDGIYDRGTIDKLKKNGITDWNFDFRPKSFNFLQQYVFLDLIDEIHTPYNRYFLHFSNEKDYIIFKFLNDFKRKLEKLGTISNLEDNIFLEFSDERSASFYDKFDCPFFWVVNENKLLEEILESKNLRGLVFFYGQNNGIESTGNSNDFFTKFIKNHIPMIQEHQLEVVLCNNWDPSIFASILNYLDFDMLALPVNDKVEFCYRNVDFVKFEEHLSVFKDFSVR